MKIAANRIDAFIRTPNPEVRAVLVYGTDEGLVRERVSKIAAWIVGDERDPFRVADLQPEQIAKAPARLLDEALAIPFGGGRRVLFVRNGGDELMAAVSALLADQAAADPGCALVVVAAGNLGPRSSLRQLFEKHPTCVALACYPDDEAGRDRLVREILAAQAIDIAPAALHTATALLGGDREANRREIEKLALYVGADGRVDEEAVLACLGDGAEASVDEAVLAAADGDYARLFEQLGRVWAEGAEPVAVIRAAQRHFQRLHRVAAQASGGGSVDAAIKQLRPPVFWRSLPRFRAQLTAWSPARLEASLKRLTEAELAAKTTGAPTRLVCDRALLAIAQLARTADP